MRTGNVRPAPRPPGQMAEGTILSSGAFRVKGPPLQGMGGLIYPGERTADGQPVAITLVDPALLDAPGAWERLQADVAVLSQLEHKNLARVHAAFQEGPAAFVISDAPSGQTLRQMIEKKRAQGEPLSVKGAFNVVSHLCNLLTYIHGVMPHGAVCPETITVTGMGGVFVTDVALSRLIAPERLAALHPGSAACVAPERERGAPPSPAGDIYAVGAILHECLTLMPAERGKAEPSRLRKDLPQAMDLVIKECLEAEPGRRYKSPQALKEQLADAIAGGPKGTISHSVMAIGAHGSGSKVSEQLPAVAPPRPPVAAAAGPAVQNLAETNNKGNAMNSVPPGPKGPPSGGLPMAPAPFGSGPQHSVSGPVGTLDEDHERYLIKKEDRMDYGPFPLREVKSQIEKGTIHADHIIHDMETGDKRRVREHPLLADFAREWEARHAQSALEHRDREERAKHRASVQKLLSGIFIVILLIGAGVGGYFKFVYKPEVKTVVIKEQSGDDFFKGVEITMRVDPPKPKKPHGHRKGPKNQPFDESTNLGDASEEGGDETLTSEQIQSVMNKNFKQLGGCLKEEAGRNPSVKRLDLEFIIKGAGNVSSVKVNGETASTVANCVFMKMQAVQFPKFNGTKTHAGFSIALK